MYKAQNPRVSIIIPTHNRAGLLPRAVDSALKQSFTDFELLIVDDCSSDETPHIVARLADPRVRTFRHSRNRGSAASRNTGIANAKGEYLAFLDDDDEFLPTKIEQQVRVLDETDSGVGMVYVWSALVSPAGETIGTRCPRAEGDVFAKALMLRLTLGIGSTSMIRRSVFDAVGRFDEAILRCEDLDFVCRLTKAFGIVVIPMILTTRHVGHASKSAPSKKSLTEGRDYIFHHQTKFSDELAKRRRVRASLWRRLAVFELRISNYVGAFRAVGAAFLTDPTTAYLVVKWMLRTAFLRLWRRN